MIFFLNFIIYIFFSLHIYTVVVIILHDKWLRRINQRNND